MKFNEHHDRGFSLFEINSDPRGFTQERISNPFQIGLVKVDFNQYMELTEEFRLTNVLRIEGELDEVQKNYILDQDNYHIQFRVNRKVNTIIEEDVSIIKPSDRIDDWGFVSGVLAEKEVNVDKAGRVWDIMRTKVKE